MPFFAASLSSKNIHLECGVALVLLHPKTLAELLQSSWRLCRTSTILRCSVSSPSFILPHSQPACSPQCLTIMLVLFGMPCSFYQQASIQSCRPFALLILPRTAAACNFARKDNATHICRSLSSCNGKRNINLLLLDKGLYPEVAWHRMR